MEQRLRMSSEEAIRGYKTQLAQAERRLAELDRLFIRIYEDAIVLGGIWGTTAMFIRYRLPSVPLLLGCYALCTGIFVGVLAMALTEVLNVIPILLRRTRLTKGLPCSFLRSRWGRCVALWCIFWWTDFMCFKAIEKGWFDWIHPSRHSKAMMQW